MLAMGERALARNTKRGKTFPNLDVTKFLMAFLVVEIHTRPFGISPLVQGIDCVAVPFFFIASAFLCFKGFNAVDFSVENSSACIRVRKTMRKLTRLYLVWTVIFMPISAFGFVMNSVNPMKAMALYARGVILVGENFYSWPLWYLLASVVAYFLVFILLRRGVHPLCVLSIAAAFALLGFSMSYMHEWDSAPELLTRGLDLYFKMFGNVRNGLFVGFFYVAIGMCLGFRWERAVTVNPVVSVAMTVAGMVGCMFITPDVHLPFCALFASGAFLLSIRRYSEVGGQHLLLRNVSTGIYLTHMVFVVLFIYGICGSTDPVSTMNSQVPHLATYVFSLVCSTFTSVAAAILARRNCIVKELFGF